MKKLNEALKQADSIGFDTKPYREAIKTTYEFTNTFIDINDREKWLKHRFNDMYYEVMRRSAGQVDEYKEQTEEEFRKLCEDILKGRNK